MATTSQRQVRKILSEAARVFHPELGGLLHTCSQLESSVAALREELERLYAEEREQRKKPATT